MGPEDIYASEPSVVVEVLSKCTAWEDITRKLDDYQSIPSMRHILHLSQDRAEGELWTRDADGWRRAPLRSLDAMAELSAIGVSLPLTAAYEGVEFDDEQADPTP
jgi:Uma2 family endonuclease